MSRARGPLSLVLSGCLLLGCAAWFGCSNTAEDEEKARLAEVERRCAAVHNQVDANAERFGFDPALVEEQHAKVNAWCEKLRAGEDLLAPTPLIEQGEGASDSGGGKTWD